MRIFHMPFSSTKTTKILVTFSPSRDIPSKNSSGNFVGWSVSRNGIKNFLFGFINIKRASLP